MTAFYDEVEIEDMDFKEEEGMFYFPCPCGDKFQISLAQLLEGEEVARCPSCSLIIRVIYDPDQFVEESEETVDKSAMPSAIEVA